MRDVVLVEKVIELPALARLDLGQNPQTGELLVALQPHPPHDERVHDRLADLRHFGQGASQFRRGDLQHLGFFGFHPGARQRRSPLQHGNVAEKIARTCGRENLFRAVAGFESFELALQHNGERKFALTGFENVIAALEFPAGAQRFEQRQLFVG